MNGPARAPSVRRPERELLLRVAGVLATRGFRTYLDPDGTDYFDLVAKQGEDVGIVEGKVGHPREVLSQALRRRAWADWVAVVVDTLGSAERLARRTAPPSRAAFVGIWAAEGSGVREIRPATRAPPDDGSDPFAPTRERFRRILESVDRGEIPLGVRWDGVPGEVRRSSGGRRFGEWRLDERPRCPP